MSSEDRVLFEQLGEPAVEVVFEGTESVVVAANVAFEEAFGIGETEILGESLNDYIVPPEETASAAAMDRTTAEGTPVERVIRRQTPGGPRWFLFRSVPFSADGQPGGYGIYIDITERKQQQQRFEELIRHSNDIISILDPGGTYLYQSPSVERTLGYDPETHVDQNAFDYVHPDDREDVMAEFVDAVNQPDAIPKIQYRFRQADGSWCWLESVGNNQLDNPAVDGFVVNSRDITARVEFEQELRLLKQVFARIFRHNVRNRLNVIQAHVEMVADRCEGIDTSVERIIDATEQLLNHSKKAKLIADVVDERTTETVDLSIYVNESIGLVDSEHPRAEIKTDLDPVSVEVHPAFGEAVRELVRNSIQHTPCERDPQLLFRTDTDSERTLILEDNAGGLPEEEITVLEEGKENSLEHSSGVGLWLVKWIVDRSGGDLSIEGTERGSRFVIRLPPASDDSRASPSAAGPGQ